MKGLIPKQKEVRLRSREPLSKMHIARWIVLSAAASAMMLAVTNAITLDLAAIPLFWIVPLSIYLFSFIMTFKRKIWYPHWLKDRFSFAVIIGFFLFLLMLQSYQLPVWILLVLHPVILLIICVTCHGELIQSKPSSVCHITLFYILISFGAFLGSILVSWVIPFISTSIIEYPASLFLAVLAIGIGDRQNQLPRSTVVQLLLLIAVIITWPLTIDVILPGKSNLLAAGYGLIITVFYFIYVIKGWHLQPV